MKSAKPYIAQHKDRFIDELISLLKIPSISADKAYAKDVIRTADVIKSSLEKAGCDACRNMPDSRVPYCVRRKNNRPNTSNHISVWSL